jgi:hypothetical protein
MTASCPLMLNLNSQLMAFLDDDHLASSNNVSGLIGLRIRDRRAKSHSAT